MAKKKLDLGAALVTLTEALQCAVHILVDYAHHDEATCPAYKDKHNTCTCQLRQRQIELAKKLREIETKGGLEWIRQ